jgi:hypothetical protein
MVFEDQVGSVRGEGMVAPIRLSLLEDALDGTEVE